MQCYPQAFGPRATLYNFGAEFFSVDLGTSQYLYNLVTAQRSNSLAVLAAVSVQWDIVSTFYSDGHRRLCLRLLRVHLSLFISTCAFAV